MLWNYDYHCPHCDHKLTENDQISFLVKAKNNIKSTLQISAVPGVYGYESSTHLGLEHGDRVDFFCSSCQSNLQSETFIEFVELNLKVAENIVFEVFFSPVYGEEVTYIKTEEGLVQYTETFFSRDAV